MKKFTTVIISLFLLSSSTCLSQSGWFFQNPLPTTSSIQSASFINLNTGYFVGYCNSIFKTTNGGLTFTQQNQANFNHFENVQFFNTNTGYASGNYSILKTSNSGVNWFQIYTGVRDMYFVDYGIGYIMDWNNILFKTTNGGANWNTINSLTADYHLYFINSLTGFGGGPNIIKSTNGGINWFPCTGTSLGITDFSFVDFNTGYAVGSNGNILKTTNSGNNWQTLNTGTNTDLNSVKFINEGTGFAVGSNTLLKTTTGGNSWVSYNIGNYILYSICFSDLSTGYIAGFNGYIFKTTNCGNTWDMLNFGTRGTLRSIYFPTNSIVGFCAGDQGLILNTINGGSSWNIQNSGTLNLNSIYFLNNYTGYIACDSGKILKTINSGINWAIQNTGISNNLFGIYFFNVSTGFVSGVGGNLLKTTNGGLSWNAVPLGITSSLNSIYFYDPNTGFVAGGGHVLKSTNGGSSWSIQYINTGTYCNFASLYFLSSSTGYVAGVKQDTIFPFHNLGIILKTTDGGNNWNRQIGFYGNINSIKFTSYDVGYITSGFERMYTTNGGMNWVMLNCASGLNTFNSLYFIGADTGYLVGYNGVILKTVDAGGIYSGINNQPNNEIPSSFSLSQNCPNPFNPVTKIKYDLPTVGTRRGAFVQLIIYDVLGREIVTLVNETQKPGSYEVTWDGSRYASGVYFYKLMTEEFVETKKMVLIK